ncbi:MAG: hypothetical protein G01um101425_848 [Candidatus Peregrinibacteria bacterium Gr01-1014_25]|nr:MAG: hypothetical protein G01um101425_848 [Candidatus Peregrinibacteria bacterium Gr01-1014_25]
MNPWLLGTLLILITVVFIFVLRTIKIPESPENSMKSWGIWVPFFFGAALVGGFWWMTASGGKSDAPTNDRNPYFDTTPNIDGYVWKQKEPRTIMLPKPPKGRVWVVLVDDKDMHGLRAAGPDRNEFSFPPHVPTPTSTRAYHEEDTRNEERWSTKVSQPLVQQP